MFTEAYSYFGLSRLKLSFAHNEQFIPTRGEGMMLKSKKNGPKRKK